MKATHSEPLDVGRKQGGLESGDCAQTRPWRGEIIKMRQNTNKENDLGLERQEPRRWAIHHRTRRHRLRPRRRKVICSLHGMMGVVRQSWLKIKLIDKR